MIKFSQKFPNLQYPVFIGQNSYLNLVEIIVKVNHMIWRKWRGKYLGVFTKEDGRANRRTNG